MCKAPWLVHARRPVLNLCDGHQSMLRPQENPIAPRLAMVTSSMPLKGRAAPCTLAKSSLTGRLAWRRAAHTSSKLRCGGGGGEVGPEAHFSASSPRAPFSSGY